MILFFEHFAKWSSVDCSFFKKCQRLYKKSTFLYNVRGDMSGKLKTLSWNAKLVTLIVNADNSEDQEQVIENEQSSGFRAAFL